jgi:hypothetical protein
MNTPDSSSSASVQNESDDDYTFVVTREMSRELLERCLQCMKRDGFEGIEQYINLESVPFEPFVIP